MKINENYTLEIHGLHQFLAQLNWWHYNVKLLGVVKTNHARFPKDYIEMTMKNWPAGSHIVLTGSASEGVDLISVGYKYNSRKVVCFISTYNAGSMIPSSYYEATWLDNNGNTMCHQIPHLQIISKYFQHSNAIDKHNHVCQFLLQLKKHWITEDGYFHIKTMFFGMGVTNCWKEYRFHLGNWHQHKNISIDAFVDLLCHDLICNQLSDVTAEEATLVIQSTPPSCMLPAESHCTIVPVLPMVQVTCDSTVVSSLTYLNDLMASKLEILLHKLTKWKKVRFKLIQQLHHYIAHNECNAKLV